MSWQLASLVIVLVALAGSFWWYERSHPSSKEVALVATMAALSALGRDAFAALPDVKPTTTMVLICGYAFGVGPGFAVGAVGGLASNIFLGQGSWTPWQMIAWALVGVAGGLLGGLLDRRPLGRWTLALVCGLAAEGFNLLIDFYSWSVGGTHTLSAYGAWVASAFSFDITHVVSSFLFGLAFGPALMRMLARARARLEITWEPLPAAPVLAAVIVAGGGLLAAGAAHASASEPRAHTSSLSAQVSFLASAQNADGGYGGAPGQNSSELYTAWAAIGLAAAGRDPADVRRGGHSPLDSLRSQVGTLDGLGDVERTILAARACDASAYSFAGRDLVAEMLHARASDYSFEHLVNLSAFAIFALRAVGHSSGFRPIRETAGWIEHQQNSDGGFGFAAHGSASDVDDTGTVLQALTDAGARDTRVLRAAGAYLTRAQNLDGGFPQQPGGSSNAQSTAWATQGLIAIAVNVGSVRRRGSRSPIGYLQGLINPSGSIRYSASSAQSPVWVTAEAVVALAGKTFPVS